MIIEQKHWTKADGWKDAGDQKVGQKANLVLAFGGTKQVKDPTIYNQLAKMYPKAEIILGSSAGEILGTNIFDNSVAVTAISFKNTLIKVVKAEITKSQESHSAGLKLVKDLPSKGLVHTVVFADGLKVNGTKLVEGVQESLPKNVTVTGGLVGDGMLFKETAIGLNSPAKSGAIVIIGFYGNSLKVGYGSRGGWDSFGVERIITKSKDNILYELDGKPALGLFKEYLGTKAKELPASGMFFPLSLTVKTPSGSKTTIVRSFSAVDEATQSLTFFGDMPQGVPAQLMKTNPDHLIDGASEAAKISRAGLDDSEAELALLVSCIGRRIVLKDQTEEEVEEVQHILGEKVAMLGFYSYGELCPGLASEKQCQMHNQTMTITTFREI